MLFIYNNIDENAISDGLKIKIPLKTIDSSQVNLVKKHINEGNIKYIYLTSSNTNSTMESLINEYNLEKIIINSMYSIDGGTTNNNESYFTIMNDNLELLIKELNK